MYRYFGSNFDEFAHAALIGDKSILGQVLSFYMN